ncbi:MAG: AI-2E family transporter [Polyangiaceae bacterium]
MASQDDESEPPPSRVDRDSISGRLSLAISDAELPRIVSIPAPPATLRSRKLALRVLLVLAFLAAAYVVSTLWVGIIFGTVIAFTVQPLYRRMARGTRMKKEFAAVTLTAVVGLVTAAIGAVVIYVMTRELFALVAVLQKKMAKGSLAEFIGNPAVRVLEKAHVDQALVVDKIKEQMSALAGYAGSTAGVILQATSSAVVGLIVGLFTMYYVLVDWPTIAVRLEKLSPLDPRHTRALILEFREVGRGAFIGTLATAAIQGIFSAIGYAMAGVPQSVTWGIVTGLASFVPVVGTTLVWFPIGLWLVAEGRPGAAALVIGWGFLVVTSVTDYVIRPRLVGSKKGKHDHPLLTLVALLGGIEVFNLPGLIVGPILMALFLAVVRIYERELERSGLTFPTPAEIEAAPDTPREPESGGG